MRALYQRLACARRSARHAHHGLVGLPNYVLSPWFASFVPVKTPRPAIETLSRAILRR